MSKVSAKQQNVRITNQNLIIDTIRRHDNATRSELSKLLKLSVPSVCTNVDQLVEFGIVRETEDDSTGVGRKASRLRLNTRYGYIISIDLSNPCITVALSDLKPEVISEVKFDLEQFETEQLFSLLQEKIEELLSINELDASRLLVISISVPGRVNNESGIVQCGSYLQELGNVDFRTPLEEKFGAKVQLQKDINAAVIGEISFGAAQGKDNAVFVSADVGVGLGIVLGGKLYSGSSHAAGEIEGYVMSAAEYAPGAAEEKPRLQQWTSVKALVDAVQADIEAGVPCSINGKVDFNAIIQATQAGDELCVKHVRQAARAIAVFVTNMLYLLDLETVILGGGFVTLGPEYTDTVRAEVQRLRPGTAANIVNTGLKTKAVLLGGLSIGLENIFRDLLKE